MGINLGSSAPTQSLGGGLNSSTIQAPAGMTPAPTGGLGLNMDRPAPQPAQPTQPTQPITSLNLSKVETPTGLSINMSKGLSLDLEKDVAGKPLDRIRIGLGWDPVPGAKVDLDCFVLVTENGHVMTAENVIYFHNKIGQGITHNGDNRDGFGDGDDETIDIVLSAIPPTKNKLLIFANIYDAEKTRQTFGSLSHAYLRVMDMDNQMNVGGRYEGKELCRYVLAGANSSVSAFNAFKLGELEKVNGSWRINASGEGEYGNISEIANKYI